jgi:hypothetical protein
VFAAPPLSKHSVKRETQSVEVEGVKESKQLLYWLMQAASSAAPLVRQVP